MAYNNDRGGRQSTDRFGNPTQLKRMKSIVSRKTGEVLPIYKCYIETSKGLIKLEVSNCNTPKGDTPEMWCKATAVKKREQRPNNGGGF